MSLKLVLAMESDGATAGDNDEVEAANTATEVEVATSELAEVDGEVGEYADGIDASVNATEELGEVNDVLAAGVESGEGVSEETAKMAEIAVEAICAKVGISAREARVMPAMESFGSTNSRLTATKLAMEGIKETAKRVWEAIKKACIHVWNVIKGFFAGLFKSRTMLEKHLKNLKERANKVQGTPKEKNFSTGAKAFSIKGKASAATVQQVLDESLILLGASEKCTQIIATMSLGANIDTDRPLDALEQFTKIPEGMNEAKAGKGKAYGNFVNGRSIVIELDKSDKKKPLASIQIDVTEKTFATEIQAPSKDQILKIIESAESTLKMLVEYDKTFKNIEKINKTLVAATDTVLSETQKAKDNMGSETDENKTKLQDTIRGVNNMVSKIGTAIPNLVFGAVKAAADYANAGINNIGEKEKKK